MEGAWELTHEDGKQINDNIVIKIYQDGYFTLLLKKPKQINFLQQVAGNFTLKTAIQKFMTSILKTLHLRDRK